MENLFSKIGSVTMLLAVLFLTSGCGADKTPEQAQQEREDANLAKFQKIAGRYRGSLVNQTDGSSMGNIEINLRAFKKPPTSGSASSTVGIAALDGAVTIVNGGHSTAKINNTAQYFAEDDSERGTFSGTLSVTSRNGTSEIAITGNIEGGMFSGVISSGGAGANGRFVVAKGAAYPRNGQNQVGPGESNRIQVYTGSMPDPLCATIDGKKNNLCPNGSATLEINMGINMMSPKSGEAFMNNFSDLKTVVVQINIGTDVEYPIDSAELDTQNGTLSFVGLVKGSPASLDCLLVGDNGYQCELVAGPHNAKYNFVVNPKAKPAVAR